MALTPACKVWFDELDGDTRSSLIRLGEDEIQKIFDSLKQFDDKIVLNDIYNNREGVAKVYSDKRKFLSVRGANDDVRSLDEAFRFLKDLRKTTAEQGEKDAWRSHRLLGMGELEREEVVREKMSHPTRPPPKNPPTDSELQATYGQLETINKEQKDTAQALGDAMHNFEKKAGIKEKFKEPSRISRAGSSMMTAGKLLSNEYFDYFLMALGLGFGIYLSLSSYWMFGLPLMAGAILIGLRPNEKGETIIGNFFKSIIKPTGEFAMSSIPLAIILFGLGVVLVGASMSYMRISSMFDMFQFLIFAIGNVVLLTYLWVGVKSPEAEKLPTGYVPYKPTPPTKEKGVEKTVEWEGPGVKSKEETQKHEWEMDQVESEQQAEKQTTDQMKSTIEVLQEEIDRLEKELKSERGMDDAQRSNEESRLKSMQEKMKKLQEENAGSQQ